MLIDWFTVIAQILNFIILVWLLKRFLYKPVLQAIDNREKKIAMQLQDAAAKETTAENKQQEYERKNLEFDRQKEEMMNKVTLESQTEKQKLMDEARKDADLFRLKLLESLKGEQQLISLEMANRARQEVFAIARKILADLAGITLEEKMAEIFVNRLRNLSVAEKGQLTKAMASDSYRGIQVSSVFNLEAGQQKAIQSAIREIFNNSSDGTASFNTTPELVSGIELRCGGYKIAWNIDEYLNALQKKVDELVKNAVELEFKTD